MTTQEILKSAKEVKSYLATLSKEKKNQALLAMASALMENCSSILAANAQDIESVRGTIGNVMLDRLMLSEDRIADMAKGIREVAGLPDPVGNILAERTTSDGLLLKKISVPIGVIAIIYESRPNVTSDAAALCIKSGNVCILRGGKEAYRSSHAIVLAMRKGLEGAGFRSDIIQILDDTTRAGASELMKAVGYVDLLIPRGGAGLIKSCVENATAPSMWIQHPIRPWLLL